MDKKALIRNVDKMIRGALLKRWMIQILEAIEILFTKKKHAARMKMFFGLIDQKTFVLTKKYCNRLLAK